jgi:membrane dipeptidase
MTVMDGFEKLLEETRRRTLEILKVSKREEERGLELHRSSIICDSLLSRVIPYSEGMAKRAEEMVAAGRSIHEIDGEMNKMSGVDTVEDPKTRGEYIALWRRIGVTCASMGVGSSNTLPEIILNISRARAQMDRLRDIHMLATRSDDIKRAKEEGKHAIIWNIQNAVCLGGGIDVDKELGNIDLLYGFGLRVIQLTYNLRNFLADGCNERYESGLSYYGVRVVERMNQLGMLVDIGHSGYQTTLDTVEVSKAPIASTHATCKSVHMHNRGKTDEEMKSIAEKGGYVGICEVPVFLGGKGTIKEFLDHIDHAVDLIGADHVGIGTDRWYRSNQPQSLIELRSQSPVTETHPSGRGWWGGWRQREPEASMEWSPEMKVDEQDRGSLALVNWPYITVGLVSRGYSDHEIQGIIGGNFLNLLKKVIG